MLLAKLGSGYAIVQITPPIDNGTNARLAPKPLE